MECIITNLLPSTYNICLLSTLKKIKENKKDSLSFRLDSGTKLSLTSSHENGFSNSEFVHERYDISQIKKIRSFYKPTKPQKYLLYK